MNDNDNDSGRTDNKNPAPQKSYSFLLGLSRRLGNVATSSFIEVRDFLNKDVSFPVRERLLTSVPLLLRRKPELRNEASSGKRKSKEDRKRNLKRIVRRSQEVIASANTVFPITLFPDTVFVDRAKVTIIRRSFFWVEDVISLRIEDILNVSNTVGPLFGSLTITIRVISTIDHFQINYFWRNDAIYLKHIIQGYVIAQHNELDTSSLNMRELRSALEELGQDSSGIH